MKFKDGVKIRGIRPELMIGLAVADTIYRELGEDLVVTSVTEGKHSRTSLHYAGCAADLRTRDVQNEYSIAQALSAALPDDFDVVLEKTHIHLEYQPKGEA